MWVQAVRGYDNPARPDIYKTHPALVYGSPKGPLTLKKTGSASLGKGVFLPGTRQAVFIVSDKRRRYSVRSYDVARNKLSTTYVRPAKARRRVPTDLAVSKDGKILAVGLGGKESGTVFYDVETGAKLGSHATGSEVTSVSFVGQELLFSDLDGRIYRWKLGNKKERSARLLMKSRVRILTMAVHPSGASAIIGGMSGVHLVDLHNKKVRRKLLRSRAIDIRFSDDGNKVAIGTQKSLQLAKTPSVFVFVNSSP